jgi:phosphoketolase
MDASPTTGPRAGAAADGAAHAPWERGSGVIRRSGRTLRRVRAMLERLRDAGVRGDGVPPEELVPAADRLANAGMWLVVHETYARRVRLDGRSLRAEDFKPTPEGHTGGALNMVPAYVGYLLANALTGHTRAWLMGQGHCVAAVDSVNLLVDGMTPAHAARYDLSDAGLTRYVRDFYAYRLAEDGAQDSPLGSHVNAHTAGGIAEGGYLGFAELQYVHMPLPGERLVTFLSDGAFEEQRGSDWAPRWWRADDCGLVAPIMIANGRRIDQRTTMSQAGGVAWLRRHLRLNGFDPIPFDGRDPAAFAWAILEIERRLEAAAERIRSGHGRYPVPLPYGIAVAPKGAGFPGAGTNLAHNLPLPGNPATDAASRRAFNRGAARLHVPLDELLAARAALSRHAASGRPRERDNPLANRDVRLAAHPDPAWRPVRRERSGASGDGTPRRGAAAAVEASGTRHGPGQAPASAEEHAAAAHEREPRAETASPMAAVDEGFLAVVRANPHLRPRVGNPDEMRSNRMLRTLEALKFRVTAPEPGVPESLDGAVITALNEEAVAAAALGNKGGLNAIVTYEAFGMKMHGVVRQEIVFAAHREAAGRPSGWAGVPLVLTSHTWENAKNEQSHQDPSLAEILLAESAPASRVLFPVDWNTAAAAIHGVFAARGQIWTLVVPKGELPLVFDGAQARRLLETGGARVPGLGGGPGAGLLLVAVGGYQLRELARASSRLGERGVAHGVVCLLEPGRFREPRDRREAACLAPAAVVSELFPESAPARLFLVHTRAGAMAGALAPLARGARTAFLGFANRGGTLSVEGLLFVNGCSWAHVLRSCARLLDADEGQLLERDEREALDGRRSPHGPVLPEAV